MRITHDQNQNNFEIANLTVGKMLTIHRGLTALKSRKELGVVGEEVLTSIAHALQESGHLVEVKPPQETPQGGITHCKYIRYDT